MNAHLECAHIANGSNHFRSGKREFSPLRCQVLGSTHFRDSPNVRARTRHSAELLPSLAWATYRGPIGHAGCDHTCWLTIQLFRPVASSNDPRIGESLATTAAIPAAGWCAPSHAWKEHPCQGSNLTSLPFRYIESGIHAWGKHATTQHLLHLGCDLSCSTPA